MRSYGPSSRGMSISFSRLDLNDTLENRVECQEGIRSIRRWKRTLFVRSDLTTSLVNRVEYQKLQPFDPPYFEVYIKEVSSTL